ncbi:MAG: nicotinate phosphoribosyltransferase [Saccharofermentanales bacterium]
MTKVTWNNRTNMTMLTDFYEITMSQGYFENSMHEDIAYFDMFFRSVPENGGFAVMAGVEQLVDYLETLEFTKEDLKFLHDKYKFDARFLDYLAQFRFTCDVWAVPEGTPIFPGEPIVKVRGPVLQAQMIETMILLTINHQSLIATKAVRIVKAAKGRPVMEFGARRAQGYDGAVLGARAAYIGGALGTSCTISGQQFGIPLSGTMAHSWVQIFDNEYESFKAYARLYPDNTVLLLDTYNVLKSGVPNAIRTDREVLQPLGYRLKGVRIDSGDLTYLSVETRRMLDEAGLKDTVIVASNALDEYIIRDLLHQGAAIDVFGVGERLITSREEPVFGGVYKLSAVEKNGTVIPKMKISENAGKITNPGSKELWRLYSRETGTAIADVITLKDEVIDESAPYELFDPDHTWKRKTATNFTARKLLEPIFLAGSNVYAKKPVQEHRDYCKAEIDRLWDTVRRFENPQNYYVDLSQALWEMKDSIIRSYTS